MNKRIFTNREIVDIAIWSFIFFPVAIYKFLSKINDINN